MLSVHRLFVGHRTPVSGPITFTANRGEALGVVGASGAGKTTLLRTLAGLHAPLGGTIACDGDIGLLSQHPRQATNPRWILRKIIAEPARIAGRDVDVDGSATAAGLDPRLLDRFPSQVSDGQLQRACLARLQVQSPSIILCDEPTASLDPISARTIVRALHDRLAEGAVIVLASHDRRAVHTLCQQTLMMVEEEGPITPAARRAARTEERTLASTKF